MRIQIENFSKIKKANVKLDGITVIAGENNTGKSTLGKILFALINAISNIDDKIMEQKKTKLMSAVKSMILSEYHVDEYSMEMAGYYFSEKIFEISQKSIVEIDDVRKIFIDEFSCFMNTDGYDDFLKHCTEIANTDNSKLRLEVITKYFKSVFNGQITPLFDSTLETSINLEAYRNNNMTLSFLDNACVKYENESKVGGKAIYIDNPFIIDRLNHKEFQDETEKFLANLLNYKEKDLMDGIIDSVLSKEKLANVFNMLSSVIAGEVVEQRENEYFLTVKGFEKPISISRLSTGMKSFLILKMLLEKGRIDKQDVIILDEPEIHLHPQWQVVYAELIVLLQKNFNLSIVITTHSPYFLDAINVFSEKHGSGDKTNFYLASSDGQWAEIKEVTDNIELIYKKMAAPIQSLDSLRHELNN